MTPDRADEIVADLIGTCKSVGDCLQGDEDEDDPVLIEAIDTEIFLCEDCGWWCEMSEAHEGSNGDVCDDCFDGDEQ